MSSPATTAPKAGGEATMPVSGPRKTFKTRHLSMMALGSAIGAGFFLGTGVAVSEAGPAVLVSYVLAALIAVSVMFALSELASSLPSTGSFSTYAEVGIGRWAGFTSGWLYWAMLVMVLGLEITGAAAIFVSWFPSVPQWVVALAIVVVLGGVNLMAARDFGEVEAWLAGIKVLAIIVFLLIGIGLVTGIVPGRTESIGQTILGHGGFAPTGLAGIAVALLAIITSFGGIEIVTIAAGEAENAKVAISAAIRSVISRILIFYVGSVILLICLLRWDSKEMSTSPFAAVLNMAGIPAVGVIMESVVFVALVSAFSANIYASSRIAYSLSARGMGMKWLLGRGVSSSKMNEAGHASSTTSATLVADEEAESLQDRVATEGASGDIAEGRTPRRAVSVSIFFALVSVALNWLLPESLLGILLNSVGMVLLLIWVFILVAQIRLHPKLEAEGSIALRSPGWPWLPRLVIASLVLVAGLMAWNPEARQQLIAMSVLTLIIIAIYFIREAMAQRSAK